MCISTENFDSIFFLGIMSFLKFDQNEDTTESVCQRNSSEIAQQKFPKSL